MIFKSVDGNHIEILRSYFTNDTAYYNMILSVKGFNRKYSAKVIKQSDLDIDLNEINNINTNGHNDNVNEIERIKSIIKDSSSIKGHNH